jgi:integrase
LGPHRLASGLIDIRTAIAQINTRIREKDTKTHQRRRIVIDAQTLALLRAYLHHAAETAASLGVELAEDSFVVSGSPDRSTWLKPDTVTQRYSRMCERLGWDMHIHQLRHYSATELIAAGVDIRTVAGRLGHGGGGTTTLRVYSAWVAEANQRAASSLAARMPELPVTAAGGNGAPALPAPPTAVATGNSPYQTIAADLRAATRCGALIPGDHLPTVKSLARRYAVSEATAYRAVALLDEAGEIGVSRGRRAVVVDPGQPRTWVIGPAAAAVGELRITRISVSGVTAGASCISAVGRLSAVRDWHRGNWLEATKEATSRVRSPLGMGTRVISKRASAVLG